MELAAKILILAGILNIAYGLLTGIPAGMIRQNNPIYSKGLRFVHIGALMWGPILISLSLAIELSTLDEGFELLAVWFMVGSSILLNAKDAMNWLTGIQDEFAEKTPLATGIRRVIGGGVSAGNQHHPYRHLTGNVRSNLALHRAHRWAETPIASSFIT